MIDECMRRNKFSQAASAAAVAATTYSSSSFLPILAALLIAGDAAAIPCALARSPVNDTRAIFAFY
jgi:hypothetical protein